MSRDKEKSATKLFQKSRAKSQEKIINETSIRLLNLNNKLRMGRLNNSQFLTQLSEVLTSNNGESSVYVTQKRLTTTLPIDEPTPKINDLSSNVIKADAFEENTTTYPVLIRISMNSGNSKNTSQSKQKTKLSTVVETGNLDQFWSDYVQVIKNGFVGLKKKDKKKNKKSGKVSK